MGKSRNSSGGFAGRPDGPSRSYARVFHVQGPCIECPGGTRVAPRDRRRSPPPRSRVLNRLQIHQRPPHRDPHPSAAVRQRLWPVSLSVGPTTSYSPIHRYALEVAGMDQPTQNSPSVCKTRASDTPLQPSVSAPFGGWLSNSGREEVQCLSDRARQPVVTTTIFPRAQACPNPPRGLLMNQERCREGWRGAPESSAP